MRIRNCVLALALSMPLPALAGYDEGIAAYRLGDYSTALSELRPLADQGNADAQWTVGLMYAQGSGVLQDYVQAHKWLNLAAARGHRDAAGTRESIARRMTSSQIAEAQQLARDWRRAPGATTSSPPTTPPAAPPAWSTTQQATPPPTVSGGSNRQVVAKIQATLGERGYNPGPADGLMGSRTRNAIRKYQGNHGLRIDGQPTRSLLAHLQANPGAVAPGSWADTRPPAAPAPRAPASVAATPSAPPAYQTTTPGDTGDRTQALVDELRLLVRDGESRRSADGSFLRALDDLVNRYDANAWSRLLLEEFFQSVTEANRRGWKVGAGEFEIRPGTGLQSLVEPPPPPSKDSKRSAEAQALALLGAIVGQAAGGNAAVTQTGPAEAEIYVPLRVTEAFRVELVFRSLRTPAHFQIGLYQGTARSQGYSVGYRAGSTRDGIEVVRGSAGSSAVIARHAAALRLEDGRDHRLEWSRDVSGAMLVKLDGRALIDVTERGVRGNFDGVRLRNLGGEVTISAVTVHGTR